MSLSSRRSCHRANHLLSTLLSDDFAFLEPHLQLVDLHRGTVIYDVGDRMPFIYFPHEAIVSLVTVLADGKTIEMAKLGGEAMFGLASALITRRSLGRFVVQSTGKASRVDTEVLYRAFVARPTLRDHVLRFAEELLAQTLHSMACNALHSVEARCCRWILTMQDRTSQTVLPLTHDQLSRMMGVQRSTISAAMHALQSAGAIRQGRGAVTVIDRRGLEQTVCGCYEIIRKQSKRGQCPEVRT
ncbi:Crp/Fnr family transcriptional regulator [Microvirga lotononidis]|uniref:cAMP-binding protein n=1 Tax=Microvirga lotononidis TaxID=864069 RepID=I4Z3B6_9HYPH|nr:Crp/Fnr family transcriptional regulator [Microvirga lotononidis]EIM30708.1 cAMP-binding protein [Microvirga lotononidis]WQO29997.1 Crp/Fnr family transcriptional regulator [Microvirga lotononidis]